MLSIEKRDTMLVAIIYHSVMSWVERKHLLQSAYICGAAVRIPFGGSETIICVSKHLAWACEPA